MKFIPFWLQLFLARHSERADGYFTQMFKENMQKHVDYILSQIDLDVKDIKIIEK